jgi:hypothetical protein
LKLNVSLSLVECKFKKNVNITELRRNPRTPKKVTYGGTDHKVTEYLNHRLYDQKLKNYPDTLPVNFDLYLTFGTKLISTENLRVLLFGSISGWSYQSTKMCQSTRCHMPEDRILEFSAEFQ